MNITKLDNNIYQFDGVLLHFESENSFVAKTICMGSYYLRLNIYKQYENMITQSRRQFLEKYTQPLITHPEAQKIFELLPPNCLSISLVIDSNNRRHVELGKFSNETEIFEASARAIDWIRGLNDNDDPDAARAISYYTQFTKISARYIEALEQRQPYTETEEYGNFISNFREIMLIRAEEIIEENKHITLMTTSNGHRLGYFKTIQGDTLNNYLKAVLPTLFTIFKSHEPYKTGGLTAWHLKDIMTAFTQSVDDDSGLSILPMNDIISLLAADDDGNLIGYARAVYRFDAMMYLHKAFAAVNQTTMDMITRSNGLYRQLAHIRKTAFDLSQTGINATETHMRSNGDIICSSNTRFKKVQMTTLVNELDRKIKEAPVDAGIMDIHQFYLEIFIPYEVQVKSEEGLYHIDEKSHMITDLGERCALYCANLAKIVENYDDYEVLKKYAENLLKYALLTTYFFTDGNMRASQVRTLKIGGVNKNYNINPYMVCIIDDYSKSGKDYNRGQQSLNILIDGAGFKTIYCLVTAKALLLHMFEKEYGNHPDEFTHNIVLDNVNNMMATNVEKKKHLQNYAFSLFNGKLVDVGDVLKEMQRNVVKENRVTPSIFRQVKAFIQKLVIAYDVDGQEKYKADRQLWESLIATKNGHSRQTFLTMYGTSGLDPKRFGATQMSHYAALGIALWLSPEFIDDYWSDTLNTVQLEEIQKSRDDINSRYCTHLSFCMSDVYLMNRRNEVSSGRLTDQFKVCLGDIVKIQTRHPEMKVMVQTMFSSINKKELLFFECSTGSGKTHTVIEYMKVILDKTFHTSFIFVVPYGSLLADVKSDMERKGLRVGGIEELTNKEQMGVYVLKYNDIAGNRVNKIEYLCLKWNIDIKQIFFDEAHVLLTDNDYRDCIEQFPRITELAECFSVVMLSATLGGLADDIACWMGYDTPKYYGPDFNTYEAGKPRVVHSLTRNVPKNGISSYYKLVDNSILDRVPIATCNITSAAKLPKTVLSMINIELKGLIFMSTKKEVDKLATILASIFGLKAVAVITGESKVEYLNECLADPDVKIFVGTTSCTTGLNLGIQYVILAGVSRSICNVLQTYQVLGRIRAEAFHEDSFILEITTNKTKSSSLLSDLEEQFERLTTRPFTAEIKRVDFDYSLTSQIHLLENKIYDLEMNWKTGENLTDYPTIDISIFKSCIKELMATNTHIPLVFGGTGYVSTFATRTTRRRMAVQPEPVQNVATFYEGFSTVADNRLGIKNYLSLITETDVNDHYPVWLKLSGYIIGKDLATGYYGFVDGTKPTGIFMNFAEVMQASNPNNVELHGSTRFGVGVLNTLGGIPIPVDYAVCLDIAPNNVESVDACANYADCEQVSVMGSLCWTNYYEDEEEPAEDEPRRQRTLVLRDVILWKSRFVPQDFDIAYDMAPFSDEFDEDGENDVITRLKDINSLGSYRVKGIMFEPKKHSSFLFYDGTVKHTLIGDVPWKVSNFPLVSHGGSRLNTFYCVPVLKERIRNGNVNFGDENIRFGTKFAVIMDVTVVKRHGALYLSECRISEIFQM